MTLVVPLSESCLGKGKIKGQREDWVRELSFKKVFVIQHETQVDG